MKSDFKSMDRFMCMDLLDDRVVAFDAFISPEFSTNIIPLIQMIHGVRSLGLDAVEELLNEIEF